MTDADRKAFEELWEARYRTYQSSERIELKKAVLYGWQSALDYTKRARAAEQELAEMSTLLREAHIHLFCPCPRCQSLRHRINLLLKDKTT